MIEAQRNGVATIFQELTIIWELSVMESIFLGRKPVKLGGVIEWETMRCRNAEALAFLDGHINPAERGGKLSVANQQIVETCKALELNSRIIIMDEPAFSLTESVISQFKMNKIVHFFSNYILF